MVLRCLLLSGLGMLFYMGTGWAQIPADRVAPEPATDRSRSRASLTTAESFMVTAANPYAVEAGVEILRAGDNSIDALVTVQLVLNLVERERD